MAVEVFIEADFIADFHAFHIQPCFADVRLHFGFEIVVDILFKRYGFAVAQVAACFILEIFACFAGGVIAKVCQLVGLALVALAKGI